MELQAKTIKQTGSREGTRKNGERWSVSTFLFEEDRDRYPQSMTADVWDDALAEWLRSHIGESVTLRFDMEAREYNGRYYDTHKLFKALKDGTDVLQLAEAERETWEGVPAPPAPAEAEDDDLPF